MYASNYVDDSDWTVVGQIPDGNGSVIPCSLTHKGSIFSFMEENTLRSDDVGRTWKQMALGSVAVQVAACVAVDGDRILLIGGLRVQRGGSSLGVQNTVQVYDVAKNKWIGELAKMNRKRNGHQVVVLPNNNLLACGGAADDGVAVDDCEIYDFESSKWTVAEVKLNKPRMNFGMVVVKKTSACANDTTV